MATLRKTKLPIKKDFSNSQETIQEVSDKKGSQSPKISTTETKELTTLQKLPSSAVKQSQEQPMTAVKRPTSKDGKKKTPSKEQSV